MNTCGINQLMWCETSSCSALVRNTLKANEQQVGS